MDIKDCNIFHRYIQKSCMPTVSLEREWRLPASGPPVWAEKNISMLAASLSLPVATLRLGRGDIAVSQIPTANKSWGWNCENLGAFVFDGTEESPQNFCAVVQQRLTNQSRMCERRYGVTVPGGEICELTPSSVTKHHLERMDSERIYSVLSQFYCKSI